MITHSHYGKGRILQNDSWRIGMVVIASTSVKDHFRVSYLSHFLVAVFFVLLLAAPVNASGGILANFTGSPVSGAAPLTVSFTDRSSGTPTGWTWYFGDENYTEPWTEMTASASWGAREVHNSVTMPDGSIVLIGGNKDDGGFYTDVWRSTDDGATWTQMSASAGWSPRLGITSVVTSDGSIVMMGGYDGTDKNDIWRSTDNGATWTQITASAEWPAREYHSSVAMPDGSIVLMGGGNQQGYLNDVWRSTDNGATWTPMTTSADWAARNVLRSMAMPDGSIILLGGYTPNIMTDVWRSTDNGATWTRMNASAGWTPRGYFNTVALPDRSIMMMGGWDGNAAKNDMWRSMDNGATWTEVIATAGWPARAMHTIAAMPDGSVVIMGGMDGSGSKNDVWRFMPAGSSAQNPSHTYTVSGIYPVALQAYNAVGYNSVQKTGYITVNTGGNPPTVIDASVEIQPKTIVVKKPNFFIAAIDLPSAYDENAIDTRTVAFNKIRSVDGWVIGSGDQKRYIALFNNWELIRMPSGKNVLVNVTGKVKDQGKFVNFAGSDVVTIDNNKKQKFTDNDWFDYLHKNNMEHS
jgi:PKD repeat protein